MMNRIWAVAGAVTLLWLAAGCGSTSTETDDTVWTPYATNETGTADSTSGTPKKMASSGTTTSTPAPRASTPRTSTPSTTPSATNAPSRPRNVATPTPRSVAPTPKTYSRGGLAWSSQAFPTGDRRTSAVLIEHGVPSEVAVNAPYSYQIKVTNLTNGSLEDVVVKDKGTGDYRIASSAPRGRSSGDTISWPLGVLRAGQSRTITVNATATGTKDIVHCIDCDYESVLCSTTKVVKPALKLVAEGTPAALACDPVVYKFTVSNTGNGVARNAKVRAQLPKGVKTLAGKTSVEFDAGDLAAGRSRSFTMRTKANRGDYSIGATATAAGLTASSNKVATKVTNCELELTHSGPSKAFFDRTVTYKLSVKNTGDGIAKNTMLTVPMPSGVAFKGASTGGVAAGGGVKWNLGTLRPGESRDFSYKVNLGRGSKFAATATVNAYCCDAKTAPVQTKVTGIPAILMEVVDLEDPIEVGSNVTYRIAITNQGTAPGHNIRIQCMLESAMQFVSAKGATGHQLSGATINFAPVRSLAPKQKASWIIVVRAKDSGDVRFTAKMTSDELQRPVAETEATNFYK